MRKLLLSDLVAWVTEAGEEMARVEGREEHLGRIEVMDLPAARFRVELIQAPVEVGSDRVILKVEGHAERGIRTLHKFAGHVPRHRRLVHGRRETGRERRLLGVLNER